MANSSNSTIDNLPIAMCYLMDVPQNKSDYCSTINPGRCVQCPVQGGYVTGESIDDFDSPGHILCILILVVSVLTAILGMLGNSVIVAVYQKRCLKRPFDFLLMILALFDILCCIATIITMFARVAYFGNWTSSSRNVQGLRILFISWSLQLFSRSGSQFMTVLITIERYFILARPTSWFSIRKVQVCSFIVLLIAFALCFPRFSSHSVEPNPYSKNGLDVPVLRDLEYIYLPTWWTWVWYKTLKSVHYQIDFWGPLPILLIFNLLSFWEVHKMGQRREKMNMKQRKEIQAVKMFLPVVIVLLCCNIIPIVTYGFMYFTKTFYRELSMGTMASVVINAFANFPIYYYRGSAFRKATRNLLFKWFHIELPVPPSQDKSQTDYSTGSGV